MIHAKLLGLLVIACSGGDKDRGSGGPDGAVDPNRVVLHRLNRTEYDNTVRDLLGTAQTPAQDFPPDDTVAGFDDIASNLSVSPLHVELYDLAAQRLADEVLKSATADPVRTRGEGEGPNVTTTTGGQGGNAWDLWSNGDLSMRFDAPETGTYQFTTRVWASQAGPDLARMAMSHDGVQDLDTEVTATTDTNAQIFTLDLALGKGQHTLTVSFLNDFYDPAAGADRNLFVDFVEGYGPTDLAPGPNPLRDRWVTCDPRVAGDLPCIQDVLERFVAAAWRRPVTSAERQPYVDLAQGILDDGGSFDDALYWAFVGVLDSTAFLYHVEIDPEPASGKAHPLGRYELANRLSYFLWSTMPDSELMAAAAEGDLDDTAGVAAQVRRMLADPRSEALVQNFAGQWLYIRGVPNVSKDPNLFPEVDNTDEGNALRASMQEEMFRFFRTFVNSDRDMRELVDATEGEIDAHLADHYGIPFRGTGWQTVDLGASGRGGILGQAGLLMVASYPARTSPVIRGKFVLGQLLCSEPPPPPPGIPSIDEMATATTVREQLEQHRADPVCASCHDAMDPLGFGLEHFDPVGALRDEDRGLPIDATGELPDGSTFDGMQEMAKIVAADPEFPACMSEKLMTYALGRLPEATDPVYQRQITDAFAAGGYTFESLAVAVATNDTFRLRRGEP